jgi:hypothetical protein
MRWNFLAAFQSVMGPVRGGDISQAFGLMGKGMVGIFIVMLLIYLVIVILNKTTKNSDK